MWQIDLRLRQELLLAKNGKQHYDVFQFLFFKLYKTEKSSMYPFVKVRNLDILKAPFLFFFSLLVTPTLIKSSSDPLRPTSGDIAILREPIRILMHGIKMTFHWFVVTSLLKEQEGTNHVRNCRSQCNQTMSRTPEFIYFFLYASPSLYSWERCVKLMDFIGIETIAMENPFFLFAKSLVSHKYKKWTMKQGQNILNYLFQVKFTYKVCPILFSKPLSV